MANVNKKVEVKKELDFLMLPRQTVLVTVNDKENDKTNIITIAWATPVSHQPLIIAVPISPRRYSHELVEKEKEFVVNIPDISLGEDSNWCGRKSGSKYDKFAETDFTESQPKKLNTPGIKECYANLECKVIDKIVVGDHTTYFGEVVYAEAVEDAIKEVEHGGPPGLYFDPKQIKGLHHLGGNMYVSNEKEYVDFKVKGVIDI